MHQEQRSDLSRLYVAAAVFWFEALGSVALLAAYVLSPFACWGHRSEVAPAATDSCAVGEAPFVHDGTVVVWLIGLLVVGFGAVLLWYATNSRPRVRGLGCIALGVAATGPIARAVLVDPILAVLLFVWMGVPALLLLGAGWRLLRPDRV